MAEKLGVAQSTYSAVELGTLKLGAKIKAGLIREFNVSRDYLEGTSDVIFDPSLLDVSLRIKKLAVEKGLSLSEFCKAIEIEEEEIIPIWKGQHPPSHKIITHTKLRFSINTNWLLYGEGEKYNKSYAAVADCKSCDEYIELQEKLEQALSKIKLLEDLVEMYKKYQRDLG